MKDVIVITGGSGLLAVNWAITIRNQYQVVLGLHDRQITLAGTQTRSLCIDSQRQLSDDLKRLRPVMVIHTAGLTNVETCEADPDLAQLVNTDLAENLARACAELKILMVHISTDHLFSGDTQFADEEQAPAPQNVYARTKAEAELRVLEVQPQALVVRTNFYGWGTSYRQSFSDMIINSLRSGKNITLFEDVFYTPILIEPMVTAVHDLVNQNVTGICNVVGDERISKHDFGLKLARQFKLDQGLISAGNLSDHDDFITRPQDMSLSNHKVCRLLGRTLGDVDAHVELLHRQSDNGMTKEIKTL